MWWDRRELSTYHKVVRAIAGIMMLSVTCGIVLILTIRTPNTDPIIKWTILGVLVLMLIMSVLMFRSPSRGP